MNSGSHQDEIDCPACPGKFPVEELLKLGQVRCPNCGQRWRVRTQDVPGGRFLIDLRPPQD
ncbi:MAG: hypothetical protein JSV86_09970 [Gemmatimonadota bacterium]|nr:MAG: hypothetical protein JSV86_09970 [Gemmatimonadota bacterium]